jgi:hypothetical protein
MTTRTKTCAQWAARILKLDAQYRACDRAVVGRGGEQVVSGCVSAAAAANTLFSFDCVGVSPPDRRGGEQ